MCTRAVNNLINRACLVQRDHKRNLRLQWRVTIWRAAPETFVLKIPRDLDVKYTDGAPPLAEGIPPLNKPAGTAACRLIIATGIVSCATLDKITDCNYEHRPNLISFGIMFTGNWFLTSSTISSRGFSAFGSSHKAQIFSWLLCKCISNVNPNKTTIIKVFRKARNLST